MIAHFLREAAASAWANRVSTLLVLIVVASTAASIILTSGRAQGLQASVVHSIEAASSRSIIFRADRSDIPADVVERVATLDRVEWVAGLTAPQGARNAMNPDSIEVPHRHLVTSDRSVLGIPATPPAGEEAAAYASEGALEALGIQGLAGGIVTTGGEAFALGGVLSQADALSFISRPLFSIVEPEEVHGARLSTLVVVADAPETIIPVQLIATEMLGIEDRNSLSVQTSAQIAQLQGVIDGQLGQYSQRLVIGIIVAFTLLETAILYALVMMRRKDFGRRRALGASQLLITALVLAQTAIPAIGGAILGTAAAMTILRVDGDPWPPSAFILATTVLSLAIGVLGALIPAAIAARRDPLVELRQP